MVIKIKEKLTVGFTYNISSENNSNPSNNMNDQYVEWDSPVTINAVISALEKPGNKVIPIEAVKRKDYDVYYELDKLKEEIDIVFNIAEGFETPSRESIIPAMLEHLHIPFTGSDLCSLANALNKANTIEILRNYGINIAPSYVFKEKDLRDLNDYIHKLESALYPMIVKPISEGTSMGIDRKKSIVHDEKQLLRAVRRAIHEYNQPALVSPFLSGNEYTVGIVGNLILPIIELDLNSIPGKPKVRDPHIKDMDINYSKPAQFNEKYAFLAAQTSVAHLALGCTQYNRMDFREHDDKIYFLEMNPLPGLNPESSDLPKMARLAGMDYDVLINTILLDSIREYKPKFSDRFDDKRIEYLSSFVESGLSPLEYYGVGVQETGGIYFKLVKAKS